MNKQQLFSLELSKELERVELSWTDDLRRWHPIAMAALETSSVLELQVPQEHYPKLFMSSAMGINANVVMVLANNLEAKKPCEMQRSAYEWQEIIALNKRVADHWNGIVTPIQQKVLKRVELMSNRSNGILKPVIAQA